MCGAFIARLRLLPDWQAHCGRLCEGFHYAAMENDKELCSERTGFIGQLRMLLAESCIAELEPDIIILDEFQRFKYLLNDDPEDEVAFLAQKLFNYQSSETEHTKILLLSATPYKMFTNYDDPDDHYEDLRQTVNFLFNSRQHSERLDAALKRYLLALQDLDHPESAPKSSPTPSTATACWSDHPATSAPLPASSLNRLPHSTAYPRPSKPAIPWNTGSPGPTFLT
jgi:hypothetical protein